MTKTYRACFYSDGTSETVLTRPEHATLDDDALRSEALAEAIRADIVGDDGGRIPHAVLCEGLMIGEWATDSPDMEIVPSATDEQIEALSVEAAFAGDQDQVTICERALRGELTARAECSRVIAAARAMID